MRPAHPALRDQRRVAAGCGQRRRAVEARVHAVLRVHDAVEQARGVAGSGPGRRLVPLDHDDLAAFAGQRAGARGAGESGADDQHAAPCGRRRRERRRRRGV